MLVGVTGGTGFIGRRLVHRLFDEGYSIRILMRSPEQAKCLPSGVSVVIGDLSDPQAPLEEFIDGLQVLFHCAGETKDEELMRAMHVDGTKRLVAAASNRIQHWVQLSSIGAYGSPLEGAVTEQTLENPTNIYEKTKTASDHIVIEGAAKGGFSYSVLRPSKVLGPDMPDRSLFQMLKYINRGLFFFIGPVGASLNYIHVDNVIEALFICGTKQEAHGEVFNLNDYRTIEVFSSEMAFRLGKPVPKIRLPEKPTRWLAKVCRAIPGFPLTEGRINGLSCRAIVSADKIKEILGYAHKVSIEQGISELVGVYKAGVNPACLVNKETL